MAQTSTLSRPHLTQLDVIHCARTTIAAVASLLIAQLFKVPEAYWAVITAIVVMQSTLGAALTTSGQRFVGTALGAIMGALLATFCGANVIAFAAGLFVCGLICALARLHWNAYRFAGVTLAIVMLVSGPRTPVILAFHRFVEVSIGIAVALVLAAVWPEPQPAD